MLSTKEKKKKGGGEGLGDAEIGVKYLVKY